MLREIGLACLKDIIGLLLKEKGFLDKSKSERLKLAETHYGKDYPEALKAYMSTFSEEDFMLDVRIAAVESFEIQPEYKQCPFLSAIAGFISTEFGYRLDQLDLAFFFKPLPQRLEVLNGLFPGSSNLSSALIDIFIQGTYQEVTQMAYELVSNLKEPYMVVVQTPVEVDTERRKMIRQAFNKKYNYVFVDFQINPPIIGGMRVFENGIVTDHSWLARVQAISQLSLK